MVTNVLAAASANSTEIGFFATGLESLWESVKNLADVFIPIVEVKSFSLGHRMPETQGIAGSTQECIAAIETFPERAGIHRVIAAIGGVLPFCNLPVKPWERRFAGDTGEIDRIRSEDLPEPLMRGADECGRPFLTVKTRHVEREICNAQTLFQRSSRENDLWGCGSPDYCSLSSGDLNFHSEQPLLNLAQLAAGESFEMSPYEFELCMTKRVSSI